MKIEVAIEGREPYSQPLSKEKTSIGSGDDNDLVLKIKGISRKHVLVVMEEDLFYVVDQGSAGGTYINEEQLIPGQRAEFTSFFPIKLGEFVTLSLLSDEEETKTFEFGKTLPAPDSTQSTEQSWGPTNNSNIISPSAKVMNRPERGASARERKSREAAQPRLTPQELAAQAKDKKLMQRTKFLAMVVAVGGASAFFYFRNGHDTATNQQALEAPVVPQAPKAQVADINFIDQRPPLLTATDIMGSQRCSNLIESEFCQHIFLPQQNFSVTGIALAQDHVVLVLPLMERELYWSTLQPRMMLVEGSLSNWPAVLDHRDIAALYAWALGTTFWTQLTEQQQWLYVVLVDAQGQPQSVMFTELTVFKRVLLESLITHSNEIVKSGVLQELAPVAGAFRSL